MMHVELIDRMGTDLTAVNAARVSYLRSRDVFNPETDVPLLRRLAKDGHVSVFYHQELQFRITAPIFVARQLHRHHVGLSMNEVSRRYTSADIRCDWPVDRDSKINAVYQQAEARAMQAYEYLLSAGVAKEHARSVLPLALETTWIWTGNIYAFFKMWKERTALDAQRETRDVALEIGWHCQHYFPETWDALVRTVESAE